MMINTCTHIVTIITDNGNEYCPYCTGFYGTEPYRKSGSRIITRTYKICEDNHARGAGKTTAVIEHLQQENSRLKEALKEIEKKTGNQLFHRIRMIVQEALKEAGDE